MTSTLHYDNRSGEIEFSKQLKKKTEREKIESYGYTHLVGRTIKSNLKLLFSVVLYVFCVIHLQ